MIKLKTLSPPRQKHSTYLMADYAELICLAHPDGELSVYDVVAQVYQSAEFEPLRELEIAEGSVIEDEAYADIFKDSQLRAGFDWFEQLAYRQTAFKNHYPFCIRDNRILCKCDLSEKQMLYVFLLLCANLRIIRERCRHLLTTDFERISAKALEAYLPGFAVHLFGKSGAARKDYPNKLADAIDRLAENLKERNISDRKEIGEKNTGDGGLDVVAWRHPCPDDNAPGSLICFAQCTCSADDWEDKQIESHYFNWRHRIDFTHFPVNLMFIPLCFRDSAGGWFSKDKIRDSIVMDRLRICYLLRDVPSSAIDFYEAVETFDAYAP